MVSGKRDTPSGTKRCTMKGKPMLEVKWTMIRIILSDVSHSFLDRRKQQ